jgi:N6-L-threonylcarbamoyladenine synthase
LPDAPVILAFDTSAAHCAAAVLSGGAVLAQTFEDMQKGQAERLMGVCENLLRQAGVSYPELAAIGVGVGPGNFTGIRISVAAARGLALALRIPAVGVTSFEALRLGHAGPCACAVDARRDEVFLQCFENKTQSEPAVYHRDALPDFEGPLIGAGGRPAQHSIAEAIARLALKRFRVPSQRPAPLYVRPADAAPARSSAPVLLA